MRRRAGQIGGRGARIARLVARAGLGPVVLPLIGAVCAPALAGPTGATVVAGQASFQHNGATTTITASNGAIINYQSFGVARGETVRFVQPNANSRVLNRVTGPDPSVFAGTLTANGIVYIVNPSGVYFRQGALVNVGGIYAAAARLDDADFAVRTDRFTGVSGPVVNEGVIEAGRIALIGSGVLNTGELRAPRGAVVMASGDEVLVGERGSNVYVSMGRARPNAAAQGESGAPATAAVENRGVIDAPGGRVTLASGDTFGVALRNTGAIRGRSVELRAGRQGRAEVSGRIDASQTGAPGGDVTISGRDISVAGAEISASGTTGGSIRIGGEQAGGPGLDRAQHVDVDANSSLRADGSAGVGGRIIVWSDGLTRFDGLASATGAAGTRGGFIETSGREAIQINVARVYASSLGGVSGTWLMDPSTVFIQAAPTSGGAFNGGSPNIFDPSAASSVVNVQTITNALSAGTSVEIHTYAPGFAGAGDILVFAPITAAMNNGPATLTLRANRNIQFSVFTGITSLGAPLNVVLSANDGTGTGAPEPTAGTGGITFSPLASIVTRGGTVTTSGVSFTGPVGTATFDTINAVGTGAGAVSMTHAGPITLDWSMVTGAATVTTTGPNGNVAIRNGWETLGGAPLTISNSGTLTVDNTGLTLDGAFSQIGAGPVTFRQDIATTNDAISFVSPVRLGGASGSDVAMNAGTGPITFGSTLDSEAGTFVSLSAPGTGLVTFTSNVGNTVALNGITTGVGGSVRIGSASSGGAASVVVRTQGSPGFDLGGAVTLDADVTMTALLGPVRMRDTVDSAGATPRALSIDGQGVTQFDSSIGTISPLESLTTSTAGTLRLGSGSGSVTVRTTGAAGIDFGDAISLNADVTMDSGNGPIRLRGAVNSLGSGRELRLNSSGLTRLDGAIGGTLALARLETDAPGTSLFNSTQIAVSGPVNVLDPLTIGGSVTVTAAGTGARFAQGVTPVSVGGESLTISGPARFDAGAGTAALPLRTLSVSGASSLAGTFVTSNAGGGSGSQTFSGPATLLSDVTLDSAAGPLLFGSTLDGAHALSVQAGPGAGVFIDSIGGTTPLTSINVSRAGGITINGGAVTTGSQTWSGAATVSGAFTTSGAPVNFLGNLLLGANTTINTSAGAGANISIGGTINGGRSLTVNAGGGDAIIGGVIGGSAPLTTLTAAGNSVTLAGATTSGTQAYTAPGGVAVSGPITGVGLSFTGPVAAGSGLTIDAGTGTLAFSGAVAGGNGLILQGDEINLGGPVSGTGQLVLQPATATRPIRLGGASDVAGSLNLLQSEIAQLQDGFGGIRIGRTNGSGTLTVVGATGFSDPVTLSVPSGLVVTQALLSGTDNGSITFTALQANLGANLQTEGGAITIGGPARITGPSTLIDSTINGASGGAISFGSTIDGAVSGANALAVNSGAGAMLIPGPIGASVPLASLTLTSAALTVGGNISTVGAQVYNAPVTLGSNLSLASTNGPVTFGQTVDGAHNLTVNTAGATTFVAAVGGLTPLGSGSGTAISLPGIGTTEFQSTLAANGGLNAAGQTTFQQAVTLTGASPVTLGGATVFNDNFTLAGPLSTSSSADFHGNVTQTGAGAITLAGPTIVDGVFNASGQLTANGNTTFHQAVALTSTALTRFNGPVAFDNEFTAAGPVTAASSANFGGNVIQTGGGAFTLAGPTDVFGTFSASGPVNASGTTHFHQLVTLTGTGLANFIGPVTFDGNFSAAGPVTTGQIATFNGNVAQTGGGAFTLAGPTEVLGTFGASGPVTANGTTNFHQDVTLTGNALANFVGPVTFGAAFNAAGPVTTGNSATFTGNVAQTGGGAFTLAGPTEAFGTFSASGPLTANGTTTFHQAVTLTGAGLARFNGPVTFDSDFAAAGPVITLNSANFGGNVTQTGGGAVSLANPAVVDGDFSVSGPLTASGASFHGNVTQTGTGPITLTGPTVVDGTVNASGQLTTIGTATFHQAVTLTSTLLTNFQGPVTFDAAFAAAGPVTAGSSANFGGNVTQTGGGAFTLAGPTEAFGTFNASGPVTANGTTEFHQAVTLTGTGLARFNGPVTFDSNFDAAGSVTTFNSANFGGNVTQTGGGAFTLAGPTDVVGTFAASGPLTTNGTTTFHQAVTLGVSPAVFNGTTLFDGTVAAAGAFTTNGPVTFRDDVTLTAPAAALLNNDVTFDGMAFSAAGPVTVGSTTARQTTLSGGPVTVGSTGGSVTFNGRIDGAERLTVSGGTQTVTFNGPIGTTVPIGSGVGASLTRLGSGPTIFNALLQSSGALDIQGPSTITQNLTIGSAGGPTMFGGPTTVSAGLISAAGGVTFADAATFATPAATVSTTNAPIVFNGTLDGGTSLTLNSGTASTSLNGPVGSTAPLVRLITGPGTTRVGSDVRTNGQLTVGGPLILTGDSTINTGAGPMVFLGPIDSDGTPGGRSLTLLTTAPTLSGLVPDSTLLAYQAPISFARSIGAVQPLSSLRLNVNQSGTVDGRASTPGVSTIVFANSLTANGQMPIAGTNLGTTFVVRTLDQFVMGLNEKITALGSLSIFASTASLGDITTTGNLSVTAPAAINLRVRDPSSIIGYSDTGNVTIASDTGIDFVVGGASVSFSRAPVAVKPDGSPAPGGPNAPQFSTVTGGGDTNGTLGAFLFRAFGAGLSPTLLQPRPITTATRYLPLDLRAEGPTNTNVSQTIAPFVVVDLPNVPDQTSVGAAMRRELEEIAIFVRVLGTSELIEFLVGRSLYNDRPGTSRPGTGDTLVSVGRLSMDQVRRVLEEYKVISDEKVEVQAALQKALEAYTAEHEDEEFDPVKFERFIADLPPQDLARVNLARLASVFRQVEQLGLGPLELRDCKRAIVSGMLPGEVSAAELVAVIDAFNATGTTGRVIDPLPVGP